MTDDEWRFELEDLEREEDPSDEPFLVLVVGAWREALEADGWERVALVSLLTMTTIVPAALFVLMVLAMLGVI